MIQALFLLSLTASAVTPTPNRGPLPFISDDFAEARSEAVRRHVPVFVDVWAPW